MLRNHVPKPSGSVSGTKGKAERGAAPPTEARLIAQTCKLMTQSEAEVPTVTAHRLELAHRLKASSVVHVWAQAAGDSEQPAGDSLNQWREPAKDLQTLGAGNGGNSWTHVSHYSRKNFEHLTSQPSMAHSCP